MCARCTPVFLALVLVAASAGVGSAQPPLWKTVSASAGGFSADFPGSPGERLDSRSEPGEKLGLVPGSTIVATSQMLNLTLGQRTFIAGHTSYAGPGLRIDADAELRLSLEKFVEGMKGRLVSMSQTTYTGTGENVPAVDFRAESDALIAEGRFIVRGNDSYTIVYAAMTGHEAAGERIRFLRSFRIGR